VPEAAVATQLFGDFLGFNPHLHVLGTGGCFYGEGMFRVAPQFGYVISPSNDTPQFLQKIALHDSHTDNSGISFICPPNLAKQFE